MCDSDQSWEVFLEARSAFFQRCAVLQEDESSVRDGHSDTYYRATRLAGNNVFLIYISIYLYLYIYLYLSIYYIEIEPWKLVADELIIFLFYLLIFILDISFCFCFVFVITILEYYGNLL